MTNPRAVRDGFIMLALGYAFWIHGVWFGLILIVLGGLLAIAGANPKPPTGV